MNQQGLDYQYGGQWFDDMGALALSFHDAPALGVQLANSQLPRVQTNDMAKSMLNANIAPYDWGGGQGA